MNKTFVWGHRGAGFSGVQNSLNSFKKAYLALYLSIEENTKIITELLSESLLIIKKTPHPLLSGYMKSHNHRRVLKSFCRSMPDSIR